MYNEDLETDPYRDKTKQNLVPLEAYAESQGLNIRQVWSFIDDGLLLARKLNNTIYIQSKPAEYKPQVLIQNFEQSHVLETSLVDVANDKKALRVEKSPDKEVLEAVHMIKNHIRGLEVELDRSKNDIIEEKDDKIQLLNSQLKDNERELRSLKKEIEDLKTLNFALSHQANHELFR